MGMGAPLLNDYKQEFVWKRIPQTLLGGAKFHVGYPAPFYVYINQIILLIFPFILGGILTLLIELVPMRFDIGCYVYGVLMFLFVMAVQIFSVCRTRIGASVSPKPEIKHSILNEDDEVEFEGCCGRETVGFVSTPKPLLLIPLHAVFSGCVSSVGLWFLLPSVLNALFSSVPATVVLSIFGWVALCIGLYSLTVAPPPELSQYRALMTYDVVPSRPLHMALCFIINVIALSVADSTGTLTLINQVAHIVYCTLPLFWMAGILPATEPLLLWLVEQAHVHVLGGSHMANPIRTIVVSGLSMLTLLIYLARTSPPAVLIFLSTIGYCLSLDVCGLFSRLLNCALNRHKGKTKSRKLRIVSSVVSCVLYVFMLGLVSATATLTNLYNSGITGVRPFIGYGVISLLALDFVLTNVQKVYWMGVFRNPIYPADVQSGRRFTKRKRFMCVVGILRRIVFNAVSPLLMLMYVVSAFTSEYTSAITDFWHCVTVARAVRWIFQSTSASLVEVSVHVIVTSFVPSTTLTSWPAPLSSIGTQLLLIGLIYNRLHDFLHKLYAAFILLLDSWRDDKQRRGVCSIIILILNVVLLPVSVVLVLLPACVLQAPLLPWFTLPLFWLAAPRPRHFWAPALQCGAGADRDVTGDAVLYLQDLPQLTALLNDAISNGALDCHPGSQYLLRYQDRLVWVSVLERGFTYTTLQIKGLELQETSCHTIEAARIDELYTATFERESCCGVNTYLLNTLTPKYTQYMTTYSDAKNILTGIIDSPENLTRVFDDLTKCLTWVMLEYLIKKGRENVLEEAVVNKTHVPEITVLPKVSGGKLPPLNHSKVKNVDLEMKTLPALPSLTKVKAAPEPVPEPEVKPSTPEPVKHSKLKSKDASDLDLEDLLDDWDSPPDSPVIKRNVKVNLVSGRPVSPALSDADSIWSSDSIDRVKNDQRNLLPALSNRMDDFSTKDDESFSPPTGSFLNDRISEAGVNLLADIKYRTVLASQYSPPSAWLNVPVDRDTLNAITQPLSLNPVIKAALDRRTGKKNDGIESLVNDEVFCKVLTQLVAVGRWVFYGNSSDRGYSGVARQKHVYNCYLGQTENQAAEQWLNQNPELKSLFVKSFRYSVKLMIDQAVLGPIEDTEELIDTLSDYDETWYIGQETDDEWLENVMNGTENLLSISHSAYQNLYSSRTLSKVKLPVFIGALNDELVRAQWSNLSLELLYMTNDDEERYSIQAHANILRNLTVQAADPPLGYPLYTSPVTSVHATEFS